MKAGITEWVAIGNLARREIMMAFRELHEQVPDIRSCGEPAMLSSMFIHGIKRLECEW